MQCIVEEQEWGKMDHSKEEVKANLRGHYWAGEHLVSGYHGIIFWGDHEKNWRRIYFCFLLEMFGGIKSPEILNWASFLPSFFSFQLSIHPSIKHSSTVLILWIWFSEYSCITTAIKIIGHRLKGFILPVCRTTHLSHQPLSLFLLLCFVLCRMSYKWNYTVCGLLILSSFT